MSFQRNGDFVKKRRTIDAKFCLGFIMVLVVSAWLRVPGFTQGGFASHDVGGILYNAMLLDSGGLPYVDSVEFKAPGTFYLAWLFAAGGRDIASFQVAANVVALCSLSVVMLGAWRLWGTRSAIVAGVVYCLQDSVLDSMDANYVTWAHLPAVSAIVLALWDFGRPTRRVWTWLLAGGLACIAVLCKRPAGFAFITVLAISVWSGRATRTRTTRALATVIGALAAALPLAFHYLQAGQLEGLWRGFIVNEWGWRYVAQGSALQGNDALYEGIYASAYFLGLSLAMASYTCGCVRASRAPSKILVVALWAAFAFASAAVGFRFYKGYFLAAAAPLSLLAAAPVGLFGKSKRSVGVRFVSILPALLLLGRQGVLLRGERENRARSHDSGARVIARHINRVTEQNETLWVWGWHLWDVYSFTGKLAPTRFYKTMELTTSPNDSTWRRPRSPLHFRDDLAAQKLIEELRETPPDYIVLASAVPIREFDELRKFLRENYQRDRTVRLNRVQFWDLRTPLPSEATY